MHAYNFSLGPPKYLKIFIPVLNHDRIKVNIEDLLVFNRFFPSLFLVKIRKM